MNTCPYCGRCFQTESGLKGHLKLIHALEISRQRTGDGPCNLQVTFSTREYAALDAIATRQNITINAVVRAIVQRYLSTAAPPPTRGRRAVVLLDEAGRRVCPACGVTPLVKKPGPGRYPLRCEACR